jgi:16S rRNA (guanine527-N7)-methyltransferase
MPGQGTEAAQFEALLRSNLRGVCQLSAEQLELLHSHYQLLTRWNQVLNLSSIRTLEAAVVRHYCESLFLAANLPADVHLVADVGSGGGFPGIPIAALRPACEVILIESHQRKAVFLKEATRGYANVRVVAKRAEVVQERFEWLVSRAVTWEQVIGLTPGLASHLALLVGTEDASNILKTQGMSWNTAIALPWGERRSLVIGCRVSRGTC